MKSLITVLAAALFASPALAQEVAEPRTGVRFPANDAEMSLLGVGLRTGTLGVKVYAIGLYVSGAALEGPLAAHKGQAPSPALYRDLVGGDFEKKVVMKFVRDVGAERIRNAFRESLKGADPGKVDLFLGYFEDTRKGDEYELHYKPGGGLDVKAAGLGKPPIADKAFASAVFGIWLGDKPIQEEVKKNLVGRAGEVLK